MPKPFQIAEVPDDGLHLMEIHEYAQLKYQLLGTYASIFSDSMKNHWESRVYVDLFSGPGRSRVKETGRIIPGSPCIALGLDVGFDRYVFCESDDESLSALRKRTQRDFGDRDIRIVPGDANEKVDEILAHMPTPSKTSRVLTFCFADPYGFDNLRFDTIRGLATRYVDFLVLIPDGMSGNRNLDHFFKSTSDTPIDRFLGQRDWRKTYQSERDKGTRRDLFISRAFTESMRNIGYDHGGVDESVAIRHPSNRMILYRLAFYSRHKLGGQFWNAAKKSSSPQRDLFS